MLKKGTRDKNFSTKYNDIDYNKRNPVIGFRIAVEETRKLDQLARQKGIIGINILCRTIVLDWLKAQEGQKVREGKRARGGDFE